METRQMARRRLAALAEAAVIGEEMPQPAVVPLAEIDRCYTPPNEVDPSSLYYDDFTPNQKARYRLSKDNPCEGDPLHVCDAREYGCAVLRYAVAPRRLASLP